MKIRRFAIMIDGSESALVERATPGGAPTAFRIWAAGRNVSDDGDTFFTNKSAELLIAEQTARGRLYPSDFDHLSMISNRPAEAGRASGYHVLEVRESATGPELWATQIEWCVDVKAGLEEQPPRWKYFSPAFKQSKDGEVVGYLNFAVCINPKTHDLPSLNGIRDGEETTMNKKAMKAFLAKMASGEGCTDDEKKAYATIIAAFGDDDADGDEKKEAPKEEEKKEGEPEKKAEEPAKKEEEEKKDAATLAAISDPVAKALADENIRMHAEIDQIKKDALLDKRADLSEAVRKFCQTLGAKELSAYLSAHPVSSAATVRHSHVSQKGASDEVNGLVGEEKEALDRGMGMSKHAVKMPERKEDGTFVLHTVRPSDLRNAQKKVG